MKVIFFFVFFLFLLVGVYAQKFEYRRGDNYVSIRNEKLDSLLKPYKDRGRITPYRIGKYNGMKTWFQQVRSNALPESIQEKINTVQGYIEFTLYFNPDGKVIDVTLMISSTIHEKLAENEILYMYNQLMQTKMDMENLEWERDFNYGYYTNLLSPVLPRK